MTQSFDDFYWKQFDVESKDTSLAERFGRSVWEYQQHKIYSIINVIDKYQYSSGERILKEVKELLK